MAWTAPRNWSDISDDIVTAAMLNTDVRDNLLFLGGTSDVTTGHTHTGAAGMGAASMSGLTLTALGTLTFADTGAPDAAGELQRHGNDLKWYGSSVVNLTAADASAGTASLRTLGTTSVKASAGNHTHGIDEIGTPVAYESGRGTTNGQTWYDSGPSVGTSESNVGAAQSPTFTGDNVGRIVSGFWVGGHHDESGNFTYTLRLYINGSLVKSEAMVLLEADSNVHRAYGISLQHVEESATSEDVLQLKIIRTTDTDTGSAGTHFTLGYGLTNTFCNAQ